jgi:hypothetical protein
MDWSGWLRMSEEQQDKLRADYRRQLAQERDTNRARWNRMTRKEKARYPEVKR